MPTFRDFTLANATGLPLELQFEPYGEMVTIPPGISLSASGPIGADSSLFWLCWQQTYYDLWDFQDSWVKLEVDGRMAVDFPEISSVPSPPLEFLKIIRDEEQRNASIAVRELQGSLHNCLLGIDISSNVSSCEMRVGPGREVFNLVRGNEYVVEAVSRHHSCRIDVTHFRDSIGVSEASSHLFRLYTLRNDGKGMNVDYKLLDTFEVRA